VDPHRDGADVQSSSASFELNGSALEGQLQLFSPLGTTLADARWSPAAGVYLRTPEGQHQFDSLSELSQAVLREDIPLTALLHWLQGLVWPGAHRSDIGPGRFVQLGWQVDVSQLNEAGLLLAVRPGLPEVTLRVRLDR
jgi:outer membrane lipoprotein LolB